MTRTQLHSSSSVRAAFRAGTVLRNPVTGEYTRIVDHTPERCVGELLAVPGGAVAGPHRHPGQNERFEVLEGVLGHRRGDERGELGPGESLSSSICLATAAPPARRPKTSSSAGCGT